MMQFRLLIVVLIIGVLQVCTADPISSEDEYDVSRLFSVDQLQRAKDAGLIIPRLVEGTLAGLTFEEVMKFHELRPTIGDNKFATENMYKACEILNPNQQRPTSYTSAQEAQLPNLVRALNRLLKRDQMSFIRSSLCGYIGQPDTFDMEANSFGLPLVRYMEMRFMKMKATGGERVKVAKQMCCLNAHQDMVVIMDESTFTALPDGDLNEFREHWKKFETENTLKSFETVCDFLNAKEQGQDECLLGVPIDANYKQFDLYFGRRS